MLNQFENSTVKRGINRAIAEFVAVARGIGTLSFEDRR
jgi:hypothetical protein